MIAWKLDDSKKNCAIIGNAKCWIQGNVANVAMLINTIWCILNS